MSADLEIDSFLLALGFGLPAVRDRARAVLDEAKLTNPKKSRVSAAKADALKAALAAQFAVLCQSPECARQAARGREVVLANPTTTCEACHGSSNRRAFTRLEALLTKKKLRRLVIVGGSPSVREELRSVESKTWELRLIDGTERRTGSQAQGDLEWADLVLVWGGSELDHKVSRLYTDPAGPFRKKLIQVSRRGVEALLTAAADHLEK